MTLPRYVGERCECAICSDDVDASGARRAICRSCCGSMTNVQIGVYHDRTGAVTRNGTPWTANHGWSQCGDCGNMGEYIHADGDDDDDDDGDST